MQNYTIHNQFSWVTGHLFISLYSPKDETSLKTAVTLSKFGNLKPFSDDLLAEMSSCTIQINRLSLFYL